MNNKASTLKEKEFSPKEILFLYYQAMAIGDLKTLKNLMVPSTYMMTLEIFGLKISFRDSKFKELLRQCEDDKSALLKVEKILAQDLLESQNNYQIEYLKTETTGDDRRTVHYKEDTKLKKLYFSKINLWKIDLMAGRRK